MVQHGSTNRKQISCSLGLRMIEVQRSTRFMGKNGKVCIHLLRSWTSLQIPWQPHVVWLFVQEALCARTKLKGTVSVSFVTPHNGVYIEIFLHFSFAKKKGAHHFTEITRKHRNNRVKTARNVTWTHSSRTQISRPALRQWRVCMGGCNSVIDNHVVNLIDQSQFISIYMFHWIDQKHATTTRKYQRMWPITIPSTLSIVSIDRLRNVQWYRWLWPITLADRPSRTDAAVRKERWPVTGHSKWEDTVTSCQAIEEGQVKRCEHNL